MKVSLTTVFANPDQVDAFFEHTPRWKPDRIILAPTDWNRGSEHPLWRGQEVAQEIWTSYPFGGKAMPALAASRDPAQADFQLAITDAVYEHCVEQGLEFVLLLVMPKFPFNRAEEVRRAIPELFDKDGHIDLTSPAYLPLLGATLDEVRERYPRMSGFELWISEGAGATICTFRRPHLEVVEEWLPTWLAFLESYGMRHGVEINVFAHQYEHSRDTRRRVHDLLRHHPSLHMLEDNTWPEEHVAFPHLGYLGVDYAKRLAARNPLHLNFLLDTEYMGQGRIPSVLPTWIQGGLRQAQAVGCQWANGRVMWWDDYGTLDNWNLLNADLFCVLARNPEQDIVKLMQSVLSRRFGSEAAEELADLLFESQRLIYLTQTINGVLFTDHSGFPLPKFLHRNLCGGEPTMKNVDDLFAPPGTRLFKGESPTLDAPREWREQLRIFARSRESYLRDKDEAIAAISELNKKVQTLLPKFSAEDADFVRTSYHLWIQEAQALRMFVEAAAAYADWARVRSGEPREEAENELRRIAAKMEQFADSFAATFGETTLIHLASRLREMARVLRKPQAAR